MMGLFPFTPTGLDNQTPAEPGPYQEFDKRGRRIAPPPEQNEPPRKGAFEKLPSAFREKLRQRLKLSQDLDDANREQIFASIFFLRSTNFALIFLSIKILIYFQVR